MLQRRPVAGRDYSGSYVDLLRRFSNDIACLCWLRWSKAFVRALRKCGLVGSKEQVASAGDDAAKESFKSLLQNNLLDSRP